MAYDLKRCERLARAMASDTVAYMKDSILKSFENDSFVEVLADNMEENRKAFKMRSGDEAAATNILERAIVDTLVYPLASSGKFPIF